MKNNLFQYVIIGIFIFFIIVGAIMFATYRSSQSVNENLTISVWGSLPPDQFGLFTTQFFGKSDLKYTVNYSYKDKSVIDQQLVEALASGAGPDAVVLPQDLIVRYSNRIYTIPYTVIPELSFKQTFVQEGEMYLNNEGVLALPFIVDPMVLYWNRDMFNNQGLTKTPISWPELATLSPKLTKKDPAGNILQSSIALGEYRNINNAKEILAMFFLQTGNPIVSFKSSDSTFNSELKSSDNTSDLVLQFYTNFSNPNKPEYSWNRSLAKSIDAFANGDSALYLGFASEFNYIKGKNPNLNFSVALVPQTKGATAYTTFGNIWGFAILKKSQNISSAFTIIKSLTSAEAVPFWADQFRLPSARRDILGQTETNAVKAIFNKSAIISKGWYDPKYSDSNTIFQEMVESYTTGRETLSGSLSAASDRLDNLLRK